MLSTRTLPLTAGPALYRRRTIKERNLNKYSCSNMKQVAMQSHCHTEISAMVVALLCCGRTRSGTAARCKAKGAPGEFFEVELETTEPEATMEILFGMGAISSSFCPAGKDGRYRVTAQFDHAVDISRCSSILMNALDLGQAPSLRSKGLGRGTWIDHFPLCDGFEVRLPCHPCHGQDSTTERSVVYLEGSIAFGAGDHPTTRGAATFLKDHVRAGHRVLDYGTGSGVLAICAAMCGAEQVLGLDIDSATIASARRSLSLNGADLCEVVEFLEVPEDPDKALQFLHLWAGKDDLFGGFDVIVANILYKPLLRLADTLAAVVVPGAKLCLTGLRSEQAAEVQKTYEQLGLQNFCRQDLSGGWCLLTADAQKE